MTVTFDDVRAAHARIADAVHNTPVLTSAYYDRRLGLSCFFKCENFQRVGAFKFRGATNAVRLLSDADAARGVLTHSSGNHAQALALAAQSRGIPAWVVMPTDAPDIKRRAVEGYGGTVVPCEPTLVAREQTAARVLAETHATFVSPYDDPHVIAGAGTAALELMTAVPDLDVVITPVGGGGLLSGTCLAVHGSNAGTRIMAAEPELANDALRSVAAGRVEPVSATTTETVADGLRTALSERTFAIIQAHIHEIVAVSETSTLAHMRTVWERMKIVIEASSATVLAALDARRDELAGLRVGVILSGGNVDLSRLFSTGA